MSNRTESDVRWVLTREKYFSLRPKPLERWLWQQGIPQAAERVFWAHWEEGMRRGDWCSELAIRQVARDCAVDTSTVTRAYQVLKRLGLMRREDPGRDPANPFRQSIAVTEVLLPRELVQDLSRFPNRGKSALASAPVTVERIPAPAVGKEPAQTLTVGRAESKALMEKLSAAERHEFFLASRDRRTAMVFDADTQLVPEQRGRVLELLASISNSSKPAPATPVSGKAPAAHTAAYAKPRHLSPLEAARVRGGVLRIASSGNGMNCFAKCSGPWRRVPCAGSNPEWRLTLRSRRFATALGPDRITSRPTGSYAHGPRPAALHRE